MATREKSTCDRHGEIVANFSMTMHNLGLQRAADELVKMLDAGHWHKFVQGFMTFEFLPGEFDYFLTSQDITRDQVMAIRDIEAKARLEEAMDERKTGEPGYRRWIEQAWAEIPQIPGRTIMPFGYTEKEAKVLVNGSGLDAGGFKKDHREALGEVVRRFNNAGGKPRKAPRAERPFWQRLVVSAIRLDDEDLEQLYEAVRVERQKRKKKGRAG